MDNLSQASIKKLRKTKLQCLQNINSFFAEKPIEETGTRYAGKSLKYKH